MKILTLYGSSRRNGNSELLADAMLEGVPCTKVFLSQTVIRPIIDQRHSLEGFTPVADDHDEIITLVRTHDTLVFVTPLYWYGMSAPMKLFIDRWSQSLRDGRFNFRQEMAHKTALVVVAGSDHPRLKALPLIQQFKYIFDFMGVKFDDYIIGEGNRPGEVLQDQRALADAAQLRRTLLTSTGDGSVSQVTSI